MKTKSKLFIALGVFFALVVGFLIGISVDYPKVSNKDVAGTITKINNYRNSQIMKSDIQIKNELISDTTKLKTIQKILNYYYLSAVKMSADVQLTLKETNSIESFKANYKEQISKLENYEKFLSSARTDLLLAISACNKPDESDSQVLKELLNQANNVIAQMNYKNRIVLEFIDNLVAFTETNKKDVTQELRNAHDLLFLNELNAAILTADRALLKSMDKKVLLTDLHNLVLMDTESLKGLIATDVDKLGDEFNLDSDKLGFFGDNEKMDWNWVMDSEKLNMGFVPDSEKLNGVPFDAEKLYAPAQMDAEKLGVCDAEKLSALVNI